MVFPFATSLCVYGLHSIHNEGKWCSMNYSWHCLQLLISYEILFYMGSYTSIEAIIVIWLNMNLTS